MSRLVVVSNRIAIPDGSKVSAGGLTVGIMDALKTTGGMWFGWNGEINEIGEDEDEINLFNRTALPTLLLD